MLEHIEYHSSRDLGSNFSVVLKIPTFNVKSFLILLNEMPIFWQFDFENWLDPTPVEIFELTLFWKHFLTF